MRLVSRQNQRVFDRMRVVARAHARQAEARALVEPPGGDVGAAHLESRVAGAESFGVRQDVLQESPPQTAAAQLRTNGKVIDVDLIRDPPEGTESRDWRLLGADHEDIT